MDDLIEGRHECRGPNVAVHCGTLESTCRACPLRPHQFKKFVVAEWVLHWVCAGRQAAAWMGQRGPRFVQQPGHEHRPQRHQRAQPQARAACSGAPAWLSRSEACTPEVLGSSQRSHCSGWGRAPTGQENPRRRRWAGWSTERLVARSVVAETTGPAAICEASSDGGRHVAGQEGQRRPAVAAARAKPRAAVRSSQSRTARWSAAQGALEKVSRRSSYVVAPGRCSPASTQVPASRAAPHEQRLLQDEQRHGGQ